MSSKGILARIADAVVESRTRQAMRAIKSYAPEVYAGLKAGEGRRP